MSHASSVRVYLGCTETALEGVVQKVSSSSPAYAAKLKSVVLCMLLQGSTNLSDGFNLCHCGVLSFGAWMFSSSGRCWE
jgi:hypothetical protein